MADDVQKVSLKNETEDRNNFRYFNLPYVAATIALCYMRPIEFLKFSLISLANQQRAREADMVANKINMVWNETLRIDVYFSKRVCLKLHFYTEEALVLDEDGHPVVPRTYSPSTALVEYFEDKQREVHVLKKLHYNFTDWVRHILFIYNRHIIHSLILERESSRYNYQSLNDDDLKPLGVFLLNTCPDVYGRTVLNMMTRQIMVPDPPNSGLTRSLRTTFLLNSFTLPHCARYSEVTLTTLLTINNSWILLFDPVLSLEEWNHFLKAWYGGSNPNLMALSVHIRKLDDVEIPFNKLFEGVSWKRIQTSPQNPGDICEIETLAKYLCTFVISKENGTSAVITVRTVTVGPANDLRERLYLVEMIVCPSDRLTFSFSKMITQVFFNL